MFSALNAGVVSTIALALFGWLSSAQDPAPLDHVQTPIHQAQVAATDAALRTSPDAGIDAPLAANFQDCSDLCDELCKAKDTMEKAQGDVNDADAYLEIALARMNLLAGLEADAAAALLAAETEATEACLHPPLPTCDALNAIVNQLFGEHATAKNASLVAEGNHSAARSALAAARTRLAAATAAYEAAKAAADGCECACG